MKIIGEGKDIVEEYLRRCMPMIDVRNNEECTANIPENAYIFLKHINNILPQHAGLIQSMVNYGEVYESCCNCFIFPPLCVPLYIGLKCVSFDQFMEQRSRPHN